MIPGKQYTPADFLAILRRRKWMIAVPFILVTAATFFGVRQLPDRYKSETLILVVPQRVPESYVKSTVTARIEDRLHSISQQILSRTRLERIIQDFDLYSAKRRTVTMQDVVEQMTKDIDVQVIKGDAFRVSYTGEEPKTVMQVTQRLASLFIEENLRDREMLAEGSYQFLEGQLEDARRRLIEHEKKLEEYRRRYSGQLPTQLAANLQVMQNIQMQVQALTESMARDRDRRLMVERAIVDMTAPDAVAAAAPPPQAVGSTEVATGTTVQQLESARQVLRQLELRLKPEHPDVIRMKRSIANLQQKADLEAAEPRSIEAAAAPAVGPAELARQNRLKDLKTELESLDRQMARKDEDEKRLRRLAGEYQARTEATPARESELTELMRDYETLQKTYTSLLTKKEDSKVAANLERNQIGEQFKILDPARLPEKPFSPNRLNFNLLGIVFGLGVGIGLTGLREMADSSIKTEDEVVSSLSLPVLALVPMMRTAKEERRAVRRRRLLAATSAAAVLVVALLVWKFRLSGLGI